MIIMGIDYSMNSPALCIYDTKQDLKFENLYFYNLCNVKKKQGVHGNIIINPLPKEFENSIERFRFLSNWVKDVILKHQVTNISLESYSFGSSKGLVFQIAENTGLLKNKLYTLGLDYINPTPTQVKKLITGKGNAKKDEVIYAVETELNISFGNILGFDGKPIDDLCDAYAIMKYGFMEINKEKKDGIT